MTQPLDGIRAVEWAAYANAPLIGVLLTDLGADVVKIEERGVGEPLRGMTSMYGTKMKLGTGINPGFENVNRNKRSLSLDLKKDKGKEIAYKLVEKADVFYTNYGQTRASKVGVNYETLSKINPRLIYANATSYGPRGPDSEQRAWDPAAQARSGMMASLGERNTPPSIVVGAPIDTLGATIATLGILAALLARAKTGTGQMTNTSLLGSAIWQQIFNIQTALLRGGGRDHLGMARHLRTKPRNPLSNQYQCGDGKWLMLATGQFDRFWPNLCKVVGIEDPEYVNLRDKDLKENKLEETVAFLDKVFATKPRDEWIRIFNQKHAEFAYSPVNEVDDLLHDPQVLANNYFVDFNHPTGGPVKYVGCPIEFSKTPARIRSGAPEYGQHTEEVLLELGYSWEQIGKLREDEVI